MYLRFLSFAPVFTDMSLCSRRTVAIMHDLHHADRIFSCNRITHVDDILLFISYLAIAGQSSLDRARLHLSNSFNTI